MVTTDDLAVEVKKMRDDGIAKYGEERYALLIVSLAVVEATLAGMDIMTPLALAGALMMERYELKYGEIHDMGELINAVKANVH